MASLVVGTAAVRQHMERALASPKFARSERLSRLLRFVVERHLEGQDDQLKESVIAREVFGNRDYDPRLDSMVRTEAGRLRARLAEYYMGEGAGDSVIIALPKGGYVPVFHHIDEARVDRRTRSWLPWVMATLGCLAVVLGILAWSRFQHQGAPIPIAVLPLNNLSQDPG